MLTLAVLDVVVQVDCLAKNELLNVQTNILHPLLITPAPLVHLPGYLAADLNKLVNLKQGLTEQDNI